MKKVCKHSCQMHVLHIHIDEPSCRRLRLNISQYGDCSNKYITSAGIKVVYRRFGTSTSGCVLCD